MKCSARIAGIASRLNKPILHSHLLRVTPSAIFNQVVYSQPEIRKIPNFIEDSLFGAHQELEHGIL